MFQKVVFKLDPIVTHQGEVLFQLQLTLVSINALWAASSHSVSCEKSLAQLSLGLFGYYILLIMIKLYIFFLFLKLDLKVLS